MIRIVCILILGTLLFSCTTEAPKVRLNKEEKKYIDSVFTNQIPQIDTMMDSICTERRNKYYQNLKDSLIEVRIQEIEAIRNQ
jgi:hypothetical protein